MNKTYVVVGGVAILGIGTYFLLKKKPSAQAGAATSPASGAGTGSAQGGSVGSISIPGVGSIPVPGSNNGAADAALITQAGSLITSGISAIFGGTGGSDNSNSDASNYDVPIGDVSSDPLLNSDLSLTPDYSLNNDGGLTDNSLNIDGGLTDNSLNFD
jgi:hypothetical protein